MFEEAPEPAGASFETRLPAHLRVWPRKAFVFSAPCASSDEEADACGDDPGFGAGDGCFEVLGEASIASAPGEGALDHPAARLGREAADAVGAGGDLDRPGSAVGDGVAQLVAAIDAVGEDVPQAGEGPADRLEQRHGAVAVLDIGGVDLEGEQRALRIGDDVALAPLDPLSRIEAARAAAFRGFHTLAGDDAGEGDRPAAASFALAADQGAIDPVPGAVAPAVE